MHKTAKGVTLLISISLSLSIFDLNIWLLSLSLSIFNLSIFDCSLYLSLALSVSLRITKKSKYIVVYKFRFFFKYKSIFD